MNNAHYLFAVCAMLLSSMTSAQTRESEYTIKEDRPSTWSLIRRDVITGSNVPVNKRYNEFTAEEKAVMKTYYQNMGPEDEPPFPEDGLRPIYSVIKQVQAKLLETGDLTIFVSIDANGAPVEVEILQSPSEEMTKFVSSILMFAKYKPAICNGQRCAMQFPFRFKFYVE